MSDLFYSPFSKLMTNISLRKINMKLAVFTASKITMRNILLSAPL